MTTYHHGSPGSGAQTPGTRGVHGVNRFVDHRPRPSRQAHGAAWVTPQAAADRELVVLLENGGIDLNLRPLVDGVLAGLPGPQVVPDEMRGALAAKLREWVKSATDSLLESAELVLNRYEAAVPATYGVVRVLRDSTATWPELRDALVSVTEAGKLADVLILTHGTGGYISAGSGIDAAKIRSLRTAAGGDGLNIRSVYMMSCVGASLNQAWLHAGARASAGTTGNNNLPEPTTHFFWSAWKAGTPFETAVTSAYRRTVEAINSAVRGFITELAPPLVPVGPFVDRIDVSTLGVIASSRPEVAGDGSLTVNTDQLPPVPAPTASGQSLVTTVLPARAMAMLRPAAAAYSMSTGRALSPEGRAFVEAWERPLAAPGPEGETAMLARIAAAEGLVADQVAQPLTQAQIDALVSFACGIGKRALLASTVWRLLGEGRMAEVPAEMLKWTKVRRSGAVVESEALRARRRAEAELFAGPAPAAVVPQSREVQRYAYQQGYSYQQNPAIGLVAAVDWGLAAGGILQAGVQAEQGGFSLTYDKGQRLLDAQARLGMPGAPASTTRYQRRVLSFPQLREGIAWAEIVAEWGGNPYGEIETVVFKKLNEESSDWTMSELRLSISLVGRVPTGDDPRAWPLTYRYEGSYDPVANGKFEFEGEIALDAFGGLRWVRPHQVFGRSMADWILGPADEIVVRGPDVPSRVPAIPAEQAAYLRQHQPVGG